MTIFLVTTALLLAGAIATYGLRWLRCPLILNQQNSVIIVIYFAVAASIIPALVQTLVVSRRANTVVESVATTRVSTLVSIFFICILLAVSTLCIIVMSRLNIDALFIAALVLMPWLATIASTLWHGGSFSYMTMVYPIIVLFVFAMRPSAPSLLAVGISTAIVASLSIIMGFIAPTKGLLHGASGRVSEADKAILGDYLLAGPFTHSNVLGVVLALGLPWTFLVRARAVRLLCLAVLIGALLWSGSRTGISAAFASIVLYLVMGQIYARRFKRFFVYFSIFTPFLTAVFLPFTTQNPASFSYRGQIWQGSLAAWGDNFLQGNGYSWYSRVGQYENSLIEIAFNGHNWLVHMLTTGGVLMVLSVFPLLILVTKNVVALAVDGDIAPAAFMVAMAVISCLEVPTRFRDFDVLFPFAMIPLLVLSVPVRYTQSLDFRGRSFGPRIRMLN